MPSALKGLASSIALLTAVLATSTSYADDTVNIPHVGKVPKKTLEIVGGTAAGAAAVGTGAHVYGRYRRGQRLTAEQEQLSNQLDSTYEQTNDGTKGTGFNEDEGNQLFDDSNGITSSNSRIRFRGPAETNEATNAAPSNTPEETSASPVEGTVQELRAGRTAALTGKPLPPDASTSFQAGYHGGTNDIEGVNEYRRGMRAHYNQQELPDNASPDYRAGYNASNEEVDDYYYDSRNEFLAGQRIAREGKPLPSDANIDIQDGHDYQSGRIARAAGKLLPENASEYFHAGYKDQPVSDSAMEAAGPDSTDSPVEAAGLDSTYNPVDSGFRTASIKGQPRTGFDIAGDQARAAERTLRAQEAEPTETVADTNSPTNATMRTSTEALERNMESGEENSGIAEQATAAEAATTAVENTADTSDTDFGDGETVGELGPEDFV